MPPLTQKGILRTLVRSIPRDGLPRTTLSMILNTQMTIMAHSIPSHWEAEPALLNTPV